MIVIIYKNKYILALGIYYVLIYVKLNIHHLKKIYE